MRVIWRGSVSFGLVSIPVGLAVARERAEPSFRSLHRECGLPIEHQRVCPEHGEVPADDVVRGWEVAPGEFVPVDADELRAAAPDESRSIELGVFLPAEELDPLLVDRAYYLVPAKERIGHKPYVLLATVLDELELVAIGRFVAWGKQHVCALAARGVVAGHPVLMLQTLFGPDDLRPTGPMEEVLASVGAPEEKEIELARTLAARMSAPFTPGLLENPHRQRIQALLEEKTAGNQAEGARLAKPRDRPTPDLIDALKRSVAEAPKPARKRTRRPKGATR